MHYFICIVSVEIRSDISNYITCVSSNQKIYVIKPERFNYISKINFIFPI